MNEKDLKYTKEHEWLHLEGDIATIGITDFAQGQLGDIVFVEIETLHDELAKDEIFGTVEAVKTVSDLYMPVSGTIVDVNDTLEDSPDLVNSDPFLAGWMIKVKVDDVSDIDSLLSYEEYSELIS